MHRRVVVGLLFLVLVVVAGVAGLFAWRLLQKTSYEQAAAVMPASTLRASYTDWSQVRSMAGGPEAGAAAPAVDDFLLRAYDQDLTSASAVVDSTYAMDDLYGFSALDASWEMFGQSRDGAVAALALPESVDLGQIEENLRDLGYEAPPDGAGSGGVWEGSADLLAQTDPTLTAVLTNLVVLPAQNMVLMSDGTAYAESSAEAARGGEPSLLEGIEGVDELADLAEDPVSAVLWASDFACEALNVASADEESQRLAEELIADVGGVSPLAGLVMALQPDRSLKVGMYFETSDQASDDLEPRVELASGEAVGQGGTFADRFRITSGTASGNTVVLDLQPPGSRAERAESMLLSDISQGPVLFAAC